LFKTIIHFLSHPIILALISGLIASLALRLKWDLLAQIIWVSTGFWLFLSIFSPLPGHLLFKLERSQRTISRTNEREPSNEQSILVFASGFINDTSLHANSQLSESMLQRVVEGVRIYHQIGGEKLILSGPCRDQGGCQAEAAAVVARSLQVPSESVAIITAGHNTIEELEAYINEYGKEKKLIAVSSARHLKRIKLIADNLGLEVELSASDYEIKREAGRSNAFQPGFKGTGYTQMFLHEWLGMWYTRWYFLKRRETKRRETGEEFR
jgi:uncharacterized SAM-binding protein YcdF (DUF218 family)